MNRYLTLSLKAQCSAYPKGISLKSSDRTFSVLLVILRWINL